MRAEARNTYMALSMARSGTKDAKVIEARRKEHVLRLHHQLEAKIFPIGPPPKKPDVPIHSKGLKLKKNKSDVPLQPFFQNPETLVERISPMQPEPGFLVTPMPRSKSTWDDKNDDKIKKRGVTSVRKLDRSITSNTMMDNVSLGLRQNCLQKGKSSFSKAYDPEPAEDYIELQESPLLKNYSCLVKLGGVSENVERRRPLSTILRLPENEKKEVSNSRNDLKKRGVSIEEQFDPKPLCNSMVTLRSNTTSKPPSQVLKSPKPGPNPMKSSRPVTSYKKSGTAYYKQSGPVTLRPSTFFKGPVCRQGTGSFTLENFYKLPNDFVFPFSKETKAQEPSNADKGSPSKVPEETEWQISAFPKNKKLKGNENLWAKQFSAITDNGIVSSFEVEAKELKLKEGNNSKTPLPLKSGRPVSIRKQHVIASIKVLPVKNSFAKNLKVSSNMFHKHNRRSRFMSADI